MGPQIWVHLILMDAPCEWEYKWGCEHVLENMVETIGSYIACLLSIFSYFFFIVNFNPQFFFTFQ